MKDEMRVLRAMAYDGLIPEEPTELEKRRFARLSFRQIFEVGILLEAGQRAGEPMALSEAIWNATR
jgi:hypothetical protein